MNTHSNLLSFLVLPSLFMTYTFNFLGSYRLINNGNLTAPVHRPKGLLTFLLLNSLFSFQIERMWGKEHFKNEYYDYLDKEQEGVNELSLEYY